MQLPISHHFHLGFIISDLTFAKPETDLPNNYQLYAPEEEQQTHRPVKPGIAGAAPVGSANFTYFYRGIAISTHSLFSPSDGSEEQRYFGKVTFCQCDCRFKSCSPDRI